MLAVQTSPKESTRKKDRQATGLRQDDGLDYLYKVSLVLGGVAANVVHLLDAKSCSFSQSKSSILARYRRLLNKPFLKLHAKKRSKSRKANQGKDKAVQYMQSGKQQEPPWAHNSLIQLSERQGPRNRLLNTE